MKLVKLSLVAALAAGALSTASFATSLSDAIKDVDVSGYARFRYDSNNDDKGQNWKYKAKVIVNAKIDDNFFFVGGLNFNNEKNNRIAQPGQNPDNKYNGEVDLELFNAYIGYNVGNTTFTLGRQTVGSFWTDDLYGSGIKVVNTDVEGLTLAALWFDDLNNDSDIGSSHDETYGPAIVTATGKSTYDHDLYGVAAIGSYDPVSFQLWGAYLKDVTKLFAAEVAFDLPVSDDIKTSLKFQYGLTSFDGKFKKALNDAVKNSNFFGVELAADFDVVDASLGYVTYGKKNHLSLVSFEDKGSFINAGEQSFDDYTLTNGKVNGLYATLGFNIPDSGVRIGGDYVRQVKKGVLPTLNKVTTNEWVARAEYAYSKKLNFSSYYSVLKTKGEDGSSKEFRFEAKYSF